MADETTTWGGWGSHDKKEGRARSSQNSSVACSFAASILLASWRVSWLDWMLWRDSAGSSNMSMSVCLGSQPAIFGHVEAVGADSGGSFSGVDIRRLLKTSLVTPSFKAQEICML